MSIVIKGLSYTYSKGTPYEKKALNNVNLQINKGEFLGIIGHTGSGKSTLIQHLNGLISVEEGSIEVAGIDLTAKKPDFKELRRKVGLVFQYPEYQLFAETVFEDVAFGPKNLGVPHEEIEQRVRVALSEVGLNADEIMEKSPFDLSGGQKRRVALAGVIAMRPEILVLDEPTAGLDPKGKHDILELIKALQRTCSPTVIMISHNLDEIADIADRIAVMKDGEVLDCLAPTELFEREDLTRITGAVPTSVKIARLLKQKGVDVGTPVRKSVLAAEILQQDREKGGNNA